MTYEWDENKRTQNMEKHGVDFACSENFEFEHAITKKDARNDYEEERFISVGPIERRLYVMVWTHRKGKIRIISLRKANKREVIRYEQEK